MSKKNNKEVEEKGLETIESSLTKSEQFLEKNQKIISYILLGIVAIVGLYWAYIKFYKQPREVDANSQMFVAQQYFEADSFALALDGNISYPGFLSVMEDYSGTKAANLAHYYAGVCYLRIGEYDNAIKQMKKFSVDDKLLSSEKYGIIGDAYVEKADLGKAAEFYEKASNKKYANDFSTPIYLKKLGLVYEKLSKFDKAQKVYEEIYYNFPSSSEARTIQKYIDRAKASI